MPISSNDIDPTWQDGVLISDTFDVWRKKTNGHIANYSPIITNTNIADNTIQSIKLAPPAPSWDQTTGTVTTNGTVGAMVVKGGFTSGLASTINVGSAASSTPALNIASSTQHLRFNPNSIAEAWNPLVAAGDYSIIGGASAGDTKNIIIGKWSSNAHGIVISRGKVGINRVATTDAFEVNGNVSASGSITSNSFRGALSAGDGDITTSGKIKSSAITLNGNQLNAVPASTLALSYASATDGSTTTAYNTVIYNGAGAAAVTITGSSKAVAFAGALSGITTLNASGAIAGSSLSAGSGIISTTGAISGGEITGTSLSVSGQIDINNASPTIYLRDTNHRSSMIHCNSNTFYILRGDATNSSTWTAYNSKWPLEINLENNDATFGGNVTATSFNSTSSLRYKQNVQPLSNALDIIEKLQGVTFDWKETGQSDIGLIAEQVNEVVPEFVLKDEEGLPRAVDYGKLTSILIEAVKELSSLVKSQH